MTARNKLKAFGTKYVLFLAAPITWAVLDLMNPPHQINWLERGRDLIWGAIGLTTMYAVVRGLEQSGLMKRAEFDRRFGHYLLFFATILLILVVFDMITASHHAPWRARGQILIPLAIALPLMEIAVLWYRKVRRTQSSVIS